MGGASATSSLRTAKQRCDDGVSVSWRDLERLLAGDAIRRGIDTAQSGETLARAEAALRDALARATALARAEVATADGSLPAHLDPVTLRAAVEELRAEIASAAAECPLREVRLP